MQLFFLAVSTLSSTLLFGCGGALWTDIDADGIESSRALRQKKRFPRKIEKAIEAVEKYWMDSSESGTRFCIDAAPISSTGYQPSFQAQETKGNSKEAEESDEVYLSAIQEVADWLQPGTSICINRKPSMPSKAAVSAIIAAASSLSSYQFRVGSIHDQRKNFKFDLKTVSDIFDNSAHYDKHEPFAGKEDENWEEDERPRGWTWNTVTLKRVLTGQEIIGNLAVDWTGEATNADTFANFGCYMSHSAHARCKDDVHLSSDLTVDDLYEGEVLEIVSVCARFFNGKETFYDQVGVTTNEGTASGCLEVRRP